MKELFRERDATRVGYYQGILEAEGIPTHVRNRDLVTMTTDIPIPEFYPALCVVHDGDYDAAMALLREHAGGDGQETGPAAVPFEMRPIVYAGIVLIVALAIPAAAMRWSQIAAANGVTSVAAMVPAAFVVFCLAGLIRATRVFRDSRKRCREGEELPAAS